MVHGSLGLLAIFCVSLTIHGKSPIRDGGVWIQDDPECKSLGVYQERALNNSKCFSAMTEEKNIGIGTIADPNCIHEKHLCPPMTVITDGKEYSRLSCKDDQGRDYRILKWANTENGVIGNLLFSPTTFINQNNPKLIASQYMMLCPYPLPGLSTSVKAKQAVNALAPMKFKHGLVSNDEIITTVLIQHDVLGYDNKEYMQINYGTNKGRLLEVLSTKKEAVLLTQQHNNEAIFDLESKNYVLYYKTSYNSGIQYNTRNYLPSTCAACLGGKDPRLAFDPEMNKCVLWKEEKDPQNLWQDLVHGKSNCEYLQDSPKANVPKIEEKEKPEQKDGDVNFVYKDERTFNFHIGSDKDDGAPKETSLKMETLTEAALTQVPVNSMPKWGWVVIGVLVFVVILLITIFISCLIYHYCHEPRNMDGASGEDMARASPDKNTYTGTNFSLSPETEDDVALLN